MSKQALLNELTASRNGLYTVLRDIDEVTLKHPNAVGGYSVAEICGLISAWENRLLTLIQQVSQNDAVGADSADLLDVQDTFYSNGSSENARFNEVQARKRQRWPWREILQELVWVREETGWTLANMSESVLFRHLLVNTPDHRRIPICPADIVRRLIAQDDACTEAIHNWRVDRAQ